MKEAMGITLVESNVLFEEQLLEDFVNSSYVYKSVREKAFIEESIHADRYISLNCCFAQLPGNGTVDIVAATDEPGTFLHISIPSASMFLVVCTQNFRGNFKVTWSSSMS